MAAERSGKRSHPKPRSGKEHTKWKTTAMYAGREGPARPVVRGWLQRFLLEIVF